MTCEHRTACCCRLGRFGGRPSLGVCMTVCDVGSELQWPTIVPAHAIDNAPRPCAGCGEGYDPPARIESKP